MKKTGFSISLLVLLAMLASACGNNNDSSSGASSSQPPASSAAVAESPSAPSSSETPADASATRTVHYLDKDYVVPADARRIVITGAVEAMEDAILLDAHPVGAISFAGAFPSMFQTITDQATSVGEKTEPNFETILSLKPDVILSSTKFPAEVTEKLEKIAATIPYSHIATNWEANARLLGELSGKQEQAEQAIAQYKSDLDAAKAKFGESLKGKKVVALRVRAGEMFLYPETVFFNPVLYGDLGLEVPAEVKVAKAQEAISVEKFAEMNPDYLFIQFLDSENKDTPKVLEDLQNNPIIKSVNAFKNGKAFVNVVDPLAQGGTAYSKVAFLKEAVAKLAE